MYNENATSTNNYVRLHIFIATSSDTKRYFCLPLPPKSTQKKIMLVKGIATIALLVLSNVFMTLAWYGHIAFSSKLQKFSVIAIVLISWGVALLEYCFQVPANRIGSEIHGGPFTLWHLKVIQEVVSLTVFTLFMILFMHEGLKWNHFVGFFCLVLAVYFIFKK